MREKDLENYLFATVCTRTKSTSPTNRRIQAHDLLIQPDHSARIPFLGLLLHTQDIPTVITLGQVNVATGTGVGVVVNPAWKLYSRIKGRC